MPSSEFEIIQKYFATLTLPRPDVVLGIGDDCALLQCPPGKLVAVSTDTLVEGRHFFAGADPHALGHKVLAVNLSDLAATGAEPAWVSLALTLPQADEDWLSAFANGFRQLADQYHLQLIGGDTTKGPLSITVTIHGFVDPKSSMQRHGARQGDLVCVTGQLGDAALALEQLQNKQAVTSELQQRLDKPVPRVEIGQKLAHYATSAIDVSDGLLADLDHILQASAVAAEISARDLPLSQAVQTVVDEQQRWDLPLSGGDDYELCFTLNESHRQWLPKLAEKTGCPVSVIGRIVEGVGHKVILPDDNLWLNPETGFQHFP